MSAPELHIVVGSSAQGTWLFPFRTEQEAKHFTLLAQSEIHRATGYISNQLGCIEWGYYATGIDSPETALEDLKNSLRKN